MALKEYIGLARLTEVFGYLKTKLDGKANTSDILISGVGELIHSAFYANPRITMNAGFKMAEGSYLSVRFKTAMSFPAYNEQLPVATNVTIGNVTYSMVSYLDRAVTIDVGDIAIMVYDGTTLKIVDVSDSGSGGHTIEGASGTALSQRSTLQFADADASDDAVNEKTVVNVVRKRTQAQYDAMSAADQAKGIIHITDANAKPLFDTQVRLSSGSGTVADKLSSLSTDVADRVSKSGDTMTGDLIVDEGDASSYVKVGGATSKGNVRIYNSGGRYIEIRYNDTATHNRAASFPDVANGIVALNNVNNNFSKNQTIDVHNGTTSSEGYSALALGNNIPQGTAGNSRGQLFLYGNGSHWALLMPGNLTDDRHFDFPDKAGTIALISDLPQDSGWIADTNYAYRKIGSMVLIEIGSSITLANGWTTIGTLPSRYHSTVREEYGVVIGELHTSGVFESLLLAVRVNGNVQIYCVGGLTKTLFGSITLMV